jgi:hypothetical protein
LALAPDGSGYSPDVTHPASFALGDLSQPKGQRRSGKRCKKKVRTQTHLIQKLNDRVGQAIALRASSHKPSRGIS